MPYKPSMWDIQGVQDGLKRSWGRWSIEEGAGAEVESRLPLRALRSCQKLWGACHPDTAALSPSLKVSPRLHLPYSLHPNSAARSDNVADVLLIHDTPIFLLVTMHIIHGSALWCVCQSSKLHKCLGDWKEHKNFCFQSQVCSPLSIASNSMWCTSARQKFSGDARWKMEHDASNQHNYKDYKLSRGNKYKVIIYVISFFSRNM